MPDRNVGRQSVTSRRNRVGGSTQKCCTFGVSHMGELLGSGLPLLLFIKYVWRVIQGFMHATWLTNIFIYPQDWYASLHGPSWNFILKKILHIIGSDKVLYLLSVEGLGSVGTGLRFNCRHVNSSFSTIDIKISRQSIASLFVIDGTIICILWYTISAFSIAQTGPKAENSQLSEDIVRLSFIRYYLWPLCRTRDWLGLGPNRLRVTWYRMSFKHGELQICFRSRCRSDYVVPFRSLRLCFAINLVQPSSHSRSSGWLNLPPSFYL